MVFYLIIEIIESIKNHSVNLPSQKNNLLLRSEKYSEKYLFYIFIFAISL